MDDEANDYQIIKERIIPSTPANVSDQRNRVIIHEKPQTPSFKVSEQPPTQVYSSPVLRQADRLSLERQKMEKETERTLRERLELLRLKDEQKRLNRLTAPMDQPGVAVPKNIPQPQQSQFSQSFKISYTPSHPYYISLGLGRIFFSEIEAGEAPYSNSHIPNKVHSGYLFSAGFRSLYRDAFIFWLPL